MRELISDYQALTKKITRLEEKIMTIYYSAASPGIKNISGMPMPQGFSGGGLENTFIRIEALEERVKKHEKELADIAARIEAKLDVAGLYGTDRAVFWYREIHCMKWRKISDRTGKSVRHLQRISQKPIYMSLLI